MLDFYFHFNGKTMVCTPFDWTENTNALNHRSRVSSIISEFPISSRQTYTRIRTRKRTHFIFFVSFCFIFEFSINFKIRAMNGEFIYSIIFPSFVQFSKSSFFFFHRMTMVLLFWICTMNKMKVSKRFVLYLIWIAVW